MEPWNRGTFTLLLCYRDPPVFTLRRALKALPASLVVSALFILCAPRVSAQTLTGTISGTIKTSTDAVLAGANVTVRNQAVNVQRTVITDERGYYSVDNLPLQGGYQVEVDFSGFAPVIQSGVSLTADQRVTVDIVVHAATAETLVVTGRVVSLESERSTVQQTVTEALVHALPVANRDFITLASLTPGFTGNTNYPNAQGQVYWSNNVVVDGASHYSKWRGAARTFYSGYPLEAIKEVQVLTSQFSAEYGEALASVTSAVTNSGTNTRHGSLLFFAQQTVFNDIPAFTPARPPFGLQRFGATLGGPLVRDRTHLFTSYEGRRQRGHSVVTSPVASGSLTDNNQDEHLFFVKVDHKPGIRDLLAMRYNGQRFRWRDEPGGLYLAGTGTQVKSDVHTALVSSTRLISDASLNQLRVQFARFTDLKTDLNPGVYVSRNGYSIEGGLFGPYGLGARPEDTWEAADTLSYRWRDHSIKSGGGVKFVSANIQSLAYGRGAYFFGGEPGEFPNPFQFTQGLAASEAQASTSPKSLSTFLFAQDAWRVRPRLTLNVGLRYDLESIRNIEGFDVPADKNNLQPRLGVAWELVPGKLVARGGVGVYNQQHLLYYISRVQLEGVSGTSQITLAPGASSMPAFPAVLPGSVASQAPRDIQRLASEFRNPYSIQATGGVEHMLERGIVLSADYVYLRGHDLMSLVDANAPASIQKPDVRSVAQADATRPTLPVAGGYRKVIELGNQGESWYRALQLKANQTSGRLQASLAYTLANTDDQANYLLPEDSRNLAAEKGRADTDIRHNLSLGFTWQVPAVRQALSGLVLSGVGRFQSGRPYTELWGDDRNGTSQNDARPGGRNTLETAALRNIDLSLARQFRIRNQAIEGRIEAFNLLSTVNYDQYVGTLSSSLYRQPVTAFPRRRVQFAAIVRF